MEREREREVRRIRLHTDEDDGVDKGHQISGVDGGLTYELVVLARRVVVDDSRR